MPFWYDTAMLFSCAWNGLLLGLVSLHDAHTLVARRRGVLAGWALALVAVCLSGFGIYLGRFPRWNSWDVASRPLTLLADIVARVAHPSQHPRTWSITALFAALFGAAYLAFRACTRLSETDG